MFKLRQYQIFSPLVLLLFILASPSLKAEALALAVVEHKLVSEERVLDGVIEAIHKATVSAQTSGRVTKIYFDVDDYVNKGDVLLRLRDKEQRANLNAAKAQFAQADAELKRVKEVYAKKLIARAALDKAEADYEASRARVEQAEENLEHTVVRAPYSGIVVQRHVEVGETARPGMALFTGLSLESLRAAVNLPQGLINIVREHKRARVLSITDKSKSIEATSMTISPYADPNSHTFLIRINLSSGSHALYPGMAVKVAFVTREVEKRVVPISAVAHRSEVSAVYVMNEDKKISLRQVRVGHRVNADTVEILAGLDVGETIALDPVAAAAFFKEQVKK
ncbi:MAG: efflux RND transporter periplasmic adaptor subunit [Gammaproteobacteria bacterium]|nr:efflux RND transporter periplasmic adaptor subunit [Gammaproteobacteria bacterium]